MQQLSATSCLQDLAVCDDLQGVLTNAEMTCKVYEVAKDGNDEGLEVGREKLGGLGMELSQTTTSTWDTQPRLMTARRGKWKP